MQGDLVPGTPNTNYWEYGAVVGLLTIAIGWLIKVFMKGDVVPGYLYKELKAEHSAMQELLKLNTESMHRSSEIAAKAIELAEQQAKLARDEVRDRDRRIEELERHLRPRKG